MSVNIKFDPSSGSKDQHVTVSGNCNPGIDETLQYQVQTVDGSKTEIVTVTQKGKREVLMVSDGNGGYTEFGLSDGGTFNVVKEEYKENPNCEPENGVYVYTSDGNLVKPSDWDTANNDQAAGVAVITDECRFAISKELPMVNNIPWSNALYGTDVDGILTTDSQDTSITDYAGQSNTDLIRTQASGENNSNNAAHYCYAQTLNSQHGYLPAAGELAVMYNNKSGIDNTLVLIGSKSISDRCDEFNSSKPWFWSSTRYSSTRAWGLRWEYSPLGFYNNLGNGSYSIGYALPLFTLA